jgi:hypothetical protein
MIAVFLVRRLPPSQELLAALVRSRPNVLGRAAYVDAPRCWPHEEWLAMASGGPGRLTGGRSALRNGRSVAGGQGKEAMPDARRRER